MILNKIIITDLYDRVERNIAGYLINLFEARMDWADYKDEMKCRYEFSENLFRYAEELAERADLIFIRDKLKLIKLPPFTLWGSELKFLDDEDYSTTLNADKHYIDKKEFEELYSRLNLNY